MTRLGIIGCGQTIELYKGFRSKRLASEGFEITALVDNQLEQAEKAAQWFDHPKTSTVIDEHILNACDAFLIAAPNDLHHYFGQICLENKKHVLMEKPLAITEEECKDLIALTQKNNCILMVALCMRFHPLLRQFKRFLEEHYCGDLFQLSIWTEQHTEFPLEHWHNQQ